MCHVVRSVSITSMKFWESATQKLIYRNTHTHTRTFTRILCICSCSALGAYSCVLPGKFTIDCLMVICAQTSLRELTTLGIKNAENLAIPSVRNDVSTFDTIQFYFSNPDRSNFISCQTAKNVLYKCIKLWHELYIYPIRSIAKSSSISYDINF